MMIRITSPELKRVLRTDAIPVATLAQNGPGPSGGGGPNRRRQTMKIRTTTIEVYGKPVEVLIVPWTSDFAVAR